MLRLNQLTLLAVLLEPWGLPIEGPCPIIIGGNLTPISLISYYVYLIYVRLYVMLRKCRALFYC